MVQTWQATLPLLAGWAVALDCSAGTWAPVGCLMEGTFTLWLCLAAQWHLSTSSTCSSASTPYENYHGLTIWQESCGMILAQLAF